MIGRPRSSSLTPVDRPHAFYTHRRNASTTWSSLQGHTHPSTPPTHIHTHLYTHTHPYIYLHIQTKRFHHLEFYCGDATNASRRFGWGLGMAQVAKSDHSTGNHTYV